ncbi:MAG: P1 family peptidase [Planctomycetes bacterium]|nr:P1 family peptidase [Planctomycetota bacterium]
MPLSNRTLTAVPGIRVGHAHDLRGATGCTVVLCPPGTVGAVDQRGGAPGTRETDLLAPSRLVQHVNAVLLTGGSAFGLAAADGVVRWLEERGLGFPTRAGPVPVVPAAVLYDLEVGDPRARPDAALGRAACDAASAAPAPEGSVGAGAGCRVGSLRGSACATKGGMGSWAVALGGETGEGFTVAALFAVNALGDVVDAAGEVIAGLRAAPGSARFEGTLEALLRSDTPPVAGLGGAGPGGAGTGGAGLGSTVIGVVATDARLDRDALGLVAAMAHDGIARAVRPAHTLFDGDTVFALATGRREADPSIVGAAAAEAAAEAIRRGVLEASSLGGIPAARDLARSGKVAAR